MKGKSLITAIIVLLLGALFLYFENNWIATTRIHINFAKLGKSFDGFKILQLSDLHNKEFGPQGSNLVKVIHREKPDMIVITGDFVDSRLYNEKASLDLVNQIVTTAPVYYVTGNHESRRSEYSSLERSLVRAGVKVLRNSSYKLEKGTDQIYIAGIDDPAFNSAFYSEEAIVEGEIKKALDGIREFKILLSHRPEMFPLYVSNHVELTFSGHAHGGQARLPFIGGLFAPGQGFLPKYTSGAYEKEGSVMVVSRGLGNSIIPQRILNPPEVVIVTLESDKNP